jgi:hypothetical protein
MVIVRAVECLAAVASTITENTPNRVSGRHDEPPITIVGTIYKVLDFYDRSSYGAYAASPSRQTLDLTYYDLDPM